MTLKDQVKSAIETFLKKIDRWIFNERDLQVQLAFALARKHEVHLEYFVPKSAFGGDYIWGNDMYVDIVVAAKEGKEFLPVELKFKTRKPEEPIKLRRFEEELSNQDDDIIKDQGAQDLGRYGFWKDVRRLELLRKRFKKNIKNGLAIFLTNDESYLNCPLDGNAPLYSEFSMKEGERNKSKNWTTTKGRQSSWRDSCPGFTLDKSYCIEWRKATCSKLDFWYCIVEV